ncbi:MAG: hypothetical protein QM758_24255 [Armatimonas sp.]
MRVGVLREEGAARLSPDTVLQLMERTRARVLVETGAGRDLLYREAGAQIVTSAEEVFARCQIVLKIGAPTPNELRLLRPGQVVIAAFDQLVNEADLPTCRESDAICFTSVTEVQLETLVTWNWKTAIEKCPDLKNALWAAEGKLRTLETYPASETYQEL